MTNKVPPTANHRPTLWKLGGLSTWQLARKVWVEIGANDLLGRSSELAFDFLFALVPLLLFVLTLFGLFASRSVELQSNLLSYFADFLPPAAFQILQSIVLELTTSAGGGKLTFSIIIALWFASGGVTSMISALNLAYHVRESRSWLTVRAIALGLTLFISILLLAASFVVLAGDHLSGWLGAELRLQPIVVFIWQMLQWPAATLFVVMSYSLIYYFGPDLKERRWYWITPGSAFGAFLWFLASIGFRVYLHFFNTYSASYGSLGAIMILLVWLYVTGFAFLIGGEINAEIERASQGRNSA
jgi:membrane protein